MIVATTSFFNVWPAVAGRDSFIVREWESRVREVLPDCEIVIISDGSFEQGTDEHVLDVQLPKGLPCFREVVSDGAVSDIMGESFDYKGALLCSALKILGGDLLYLDLDAHLMKDPRPVLSKMRGPMFMAENRFPERVVDGKGTTMGCAGVMWFPTFGQRRLVTDAYAKAFNDGKDSTDPLLEQYCWSIAAGNAERLPLSFNADPDECEDAYVVHYCGKKDRI